MINQFFFVFKIIIFSTLTISLVSFAQNNPPNSKTQTQVLDFEADVIEGDKIRPDLFLDLKSDDLIIDDLLYLRPNFDDYYKLDTTKRPKAFL